jgi:hypothetical protein
MVVYGAVLKAHENQRASRSSLLIERAVCSLGAAAYGRDGGALMAEIKDYTCRTCGAQFDARDKLDKHNRRDHGVPIQQSSGDSAPQRGGQSESQDLQQDKRSGEGAMQSGEDAGSSKKKPFGESVDWDAEAERGLS